MKKLIAILLALVMTAISLAACQNQTDDSSKGEQASQTAQTSDNSDISATSEHEHTWMKNIQTVPVIDNVAVRGYRCLACGFKTESEDEIKAHSNSAHEEKYYRENVKLDKSTKGYFCMGGIWIPSEAYGGGDYCGFTSLEEEEMKKHMEEVHPDCKCVYTEDLPYSPEMCWALDHPEMEAMFLVDFLKTRDDIKIGDVYKCISCFNAYETAAEAQSHVQTNAGGSARYFTDKLEEVYGYHCIGCDFKCATLGEMQAHIKEYEGKTHTAMIPYEEGVIMGTEQIENGTEEVDKGYICPDCGALKEKIHLEHSFTESVRYFMKPYKLGDKDYMKLPLTYLFEYVYMFQDKFDFVKTVYEIDQDRVTDEMHIEGEGLRELAKVLLGDDFDVLKYQSELSTKGGEKYDAETDTYIIQLAKGWPWGSGDGKEGFYRVKPNTEPTITETEDKITITATITNENERYGPTGDDADVVTYTYTYERVEFRGVEHYRLVEVTPFQ